MSDLHSYFVAGPENLLPHHISKSEKPEKALIRIVSELAENGLDVFQLRAKSMKDIEIIELIKDIRLATSNCDMKLCINDNVQVVNKLSNDVDILHIGQNDMNPELAKNQISSRVKIGLSITDLDQIQNIPNFINYIGVGPIFPTESKTDASIAMGELILEEIIKKVDIPVVAIGGIKLKNIKKNTNFRKQTKNFIRIIKFSYRKITFFY